MRILFYKVRRTLNNTPIDPVSFNGYSNRYLLMSDIAFALDISKKKLVLVKNRYGAAGKSWILPNELIWKIDEWEFPVYHDIPDTDLEHVKNFLGVADVATTAA